MADTTKPINTIEEVLTPCELRVALEVAQGATSRQIAAALFVSRRTVESHLGNVYLKLGINSRSQLVRLVMLNELARDDNRRDR